MNLKSLWHRAIVTDCNSMASLFVGLLPILVLFLLGGSSQVLASGVTDLRVGSHENYVRIVIQLNSESAYTIQREEGGKVVVLSLDADSGTEILKSLPAPLGSVKISPSGKGSKVRIELLRRGVRLKEMVLMGPPRIVLDFFPPSQGAPADAGVIPTPAPATARPAPSKVTAAPAPVPPKESKPAAISWPVDEGSVPAAESASSQANDAPEKFTSWGSEVPGPEAAVDDFDHFRTRLRKMPRRGGLSGHTGALRNMPRWQRHTERLRKKCSAYSDDQRVWRLPPASRLGSISGRSRRGDRRLRGLPQRTWRAGEAS